MTRWARATVREDTPVRGAPGTAIVAGARLAPGSSRPADRAVARLAPGRRRANRTGARTALPWLHPAGLIGSPTPPFLVVACLALWWTSQAAPAGSTAEARIESDRLQDHIRFLASDDLLGRGNGTEGLERAGDYVAQEFLRSGLRAGGIGRTFFQPFDVVVGVEPGPDHRLQVVGPSETLTLHAGHDYLPRSVSSSEAPGRGTARTGRMPVVLIGDDATDDAPAGARGAALVVTSNSSTLRAGVGLVRLAELARRSGARVLVVADEPVDAGGVTDGREEYGLPVFALRPPAFDALLRAAGVEDAAPEDNAASPAAEGGRLAGVTMQATGSLVEARRTVRNVVGVLEGARLAAESVVVGAHYDHLGLGGRHSLAPQALGAVHNGADDNASGTAALLELARVAAARGARGRTIVFVAFAAEELGLLGSAHFLAAGAEGPRPVAMVNLDMIGRPRGRVLVSGLDSAPGLHAELEAARSGIDLIIERLDSGGANGWSDDTSFEQRGIPAIGFFSGFHDDYHRPTDDWPAVEPEGTLDVTRLGLALLERLADREAYSGDGPAPD